MLIGVLGLVVGLLAARSAHRSIHRQHLQWWRVQRFPVLSGFVLAWFFAGRPYPISDSTRIVGIPFPAAAFENHGSGWMDFVGPTTVPFYLANVAFSYSCLSSSWRGDSTSSAVKTEPPNTTARKLFWQ